MKNTPNGNNNENNTNAANTTTNKNALYTHFLNARTIVKQEDSNGNVVQHSRFQLVRRDMFTPCATVTAATMYSHYMYLIDNAVTLITQFKKSERDNADNTDKPISKRELVRAMESITLYLAQHGIKRDNKALEIKSYHINFIIHNCSNLTMEDKHDENGTVIGGTQVTTISPAKIRRAIETVIACALADELLPDVKLTQKTKDAIATRATKESDNARANGVSIHDNIFNPVSTTPTEKKPAPKKKAAKPATTTPIVETTNDETINAA